MAEKKLSPLLEVTLVFLRLGFTAFGGPAAHVAMMEAEVVRKRGWVTPERFLDLFGSANLLPGPSSSELAVYLGYDRAGGLGLVAAAFAFVLPAAGMAAALAWAYLAYGSVPQVFGALYGVKPVIVAIVAQALVGLAPKAVKSGLLFAIGAAAAVGVTVGFAPIVVLALAGLAAAARALGGNPRGGGSAAACLLPAPGLAVASAASPTLLGLFLLFVKLGAVVFGSGYVLLAFLHQDLVARLHWLSEAQLVDAVAVGQITPGPVFTTATFIGYLVAGPLGALVATFGIFLPGFVLVAVSRPLVARIRSSPALSAFFDGVNVASLALMGVVSLAVGRAALVDATTVVLGIGSLVLLLRTKVSSVWLIAGGALVGAMVPHP